MGSFVCRIGAVGAHCCVQRLEGLVWCGWSTEVTFITLVTTPTSPLAFLSFLTLCPLSHYSYGFAKLRGCVKFTEIRGKVYVIELK